LVTGRCGPRIHGFRNRGHGCGFGGFGADGRARRRQPELLVLATGTGSLILSHVNDPGFWMIQSFFKLELKETLSTWSVMETVTFSGRAGDHAAAGGGATLGLS